MNRARKIEQAYRARYEQVLKPLEERLRENLVSTVATFPRVDRIVTRAKSVDSFVKKATQEEDGVPKYTDPLAQIQDQLGARIVTFYLFDVEEISGVVDDYYASIEAQRIVPDSESEFGYEGKHYILFLPTDVQPTDASGDDMPEFFELQIKTLFQHAWSEAGHDLAYKGNKGLSTEVRRKVAFTAAQAWGADMIFSEIARSES